MLDFILQALATWQALTCIAAIGAIPAIAGIAVGEACWQLFDRLRTPTTFRE